VASLLHVDKLYEAKTYPAEVQGKAKVKTGLDWVPINDTTRNIDQL